MVSRRRRRRDAGLTLVELMVSLVIGGIVTSTAYLFFAGQRRVYEAQGKALGVQQNLWGAMETLTRFVRAAGTGMIGCVADGDPPPGGATAPQTGLRAFLASPAAGTGVARLAPIWIKNGAAGAPDGLTVVFGSGGSGVFTDTALAASVSHATDPFTTPAGLTGVFRAGDLALLVDTTSSPVGPPAGDRGCTLFQITGADAPSSTLLRAAGGAFNPNGDPAGLVPFTYVGGSNTGAKAGIRTFGALSWVQFTIDATGPSPRLMMARLDGQAGPTTPQVLADGIEDLQIAYACDFLPAAPAASDGVLSEGTDAASKANDEWIYNTPGDVPAAACVRPQAVRITVIARSTIPDDNLAGVAANAKPAAEDGAAGAKDNYRHRVLTTVVYPRNR